MAAIIRNPVDWGADQLRRAASHAESVAHSLHGTETGAQARHPEVRRLEVNDLREVLAKGLADFGAYRTDVVFLCVIYPVVGIVLARFAFDFNMLPLLLPVTFGFLLLGVVVIQNFLYVWRVAF